MNKNIPAVSIVIPMYNAEKYVGECLDSILAQTFQDYEVIIVDDGSTDNSCAIVESYLPKFNKGGGGKARLIRSKVNSGSGAAPRNIGLRSSCGEYLFFMDNDDALVNDALEMLYNFAEKFNADVVHSDKYLQAPDETVTTIRNELKVIIKQPETDINIPMLMSNDISERIDNFATGKMRWEPWSNFIRRDFITFNDINFPNLNVADDLVLTVKMLCLAEKFLLIPNAFYVWRVRFNSNNRVKLSPLQTIQKRAGDVFGVINYFEEFINTHDFFVNNFEYKYKLFNIIAHSESGSILPIYAQIPAWQLDPFVRRELEEIEDKTALTAFLFSRMNIFNLQLNQAIHLLNQQPKEVQDFQRQQQVIQQQQQIIQQQAAQLQQLQHRLNDIQNIFR